MKNASFVLITMTILICTYPQHTRCQTPFEWPAGDHTISEGTLEINRRQLPTQMAAGIIIDEVDCREIDLLIVRAQEHEPGHLGILPDHPHHRSSNGAEGVGAHSSKRCSQITDFLYLHYHYCTGDTPDHLSGTPFANHVHCRHQPMHAETDHPASPKGCRSDSDGPRQSHVHPAHHRLSQPQTASAWLDQGGPLFESTQAWKIANPTNLHAPQKNQSDDGENAVPQGSANGTNAGAWSLLTDPIRNELVFIDSGEWTIAFRERCAQPHPIGRPPGVLFKSNQPTVTQQQLLWTISEWWPLMNKSSRTENDDPRWLAGALTNPSAWWCVRGSRTGEQWHYQLGAGDPMVPKISDYGTIHDPPSSTLPRVAQDTHHQFSQLEQAIQELDMPTVDSNGMKRIEQVQDHLRRLARLHQAPQASLSIPDFSAVALVGPAFIIRSKP